MAISAVTQAFSHYAQRTTGGSSAPSTGSASAEQEAGETLATTKNEAAHGDHQAKLKLAKLTQQQSNSAPPTEPGKGEVIDKKG